MNPTQVNKPSFIKSLCLFTNILDVKNKTVIYRFRVDKSKHKAIKVGTTLWVKKKGKRKSKNQLSDKEVSL